MPSQIIFPRPAVGRFIYPAGDPGALTLAAGLLYATPWSLGGFDRPLVDQIGFRCTTAPTGAGAGVWVGIAEDADGVPGRLLASFLQPAVTLAGHASPIFTGTLSLPDLVWALAISDTYATTQPQVAAIAAAGAAQVAPSGIGVSSLANLPSTNATVPTGYTLARTFAQGLPGDGRGLGWAIAANTAMPLVAARVAGYSSAVRPGEVTDPTENTVTTPGAIQVPSGGVQTRTPPLGAMPPRVPDDPGRAVPVIQQLPV